MKKATVFFTLALAALILFVSCGEDPFFHDVTVTDRDKVTTEIVFNGNEYTLPANSDAEFLGWKVNDEKYIKAPGVKVTINGETSIKAIYTDTEDDTICLLMYVLSDSNYTGSFTDSTKKTVLVPTDKIILPEGSEMKSNGGNFDGWYTAEDADGNRKYYEGGSEITVTSFTKLYANWIDPKLKYEVSTEDSTVTVSADDKTATSYKISSWYQGNKVTIIGENAFNDTSITSIKLPDTITTILDCAFRSCYDLESCNLPGSLETIGYGAFENTGITSCVLPDGLKTIGGYAFSGCDLTGDIVIPASVTSIGDVAFSANKKLTGFEFEEGSTINAIPKSMFRGCSITSLSGLPATVTKIGEYAFGSNAFTSLTLPDSITEIGEEAFEYCSSLTTVEIGSRISTIDEKTFNGCTALTSIKINKTAGEIRAMRGFDKKWSYDGSHDVESSAKIYDASGAEVTASSGS